MLTIRGNTLHTGSGPVKDWQIASRGALVDPFLLVLLAHASSRSPDLLARTSVPRSKVHVSIDREGQYSQFIEFHRLGDAIGSGEWRGHSGLDQLAICVSLENEGRLLRRADESWQSALHRTIPPEQVVQRPARPNTSDISSAWHCYSEAQLASALRVTESICHTYPIADVVTADEISPLGGRCLGFPFPIDEFRNSCRLR